MMILGQILMVVTSYVDVKVVAKNPFILIGIADIVLCISKVNIIVDILDVQTKYLTQVHHATVMNIIDNNIVIIFALQPDSWNCNLLVQIATYPYFVSKVE